MSINEEEGDPKMRYNHITKRYELTVEDAKRLADPTKLHPGIMLPGDLKAFPNPIKPGEYTVKKSINDVTPEEWDEVTTKKLRKRFNRRIDRAVNKTKEEYNKLLEFKRLDEKREAKENEEAGVSIVNARGNILTGCYETDIKILTDKILASAEKYEKLSTKYCDSLQEAINIKTTFNKKYEVVTEEKEELRNAYMIASSACTDLKEQLRFAEDTLKKLGYIRPSSEFRSYAKVRSKSIPE